MSQVCLDGKTVIITGANTGIGYETAADLAKRGAKVIIACRNEEKARRAVDRLKNETKNPNISYKILNLASLKSVCKFAEEIIQTEPRLDILINNAGLYVVPGPAFTDDGLEAVMQTNYYGHFLLTNLLLDLLKKSGPSRIVNVASVAGSYTPLELSEINSDKPSKPTIYGRSKLCNILFTIELAARLKGTNVTCYSVHPGVIASEFTRDFPGIIKTVLDVILVWFFKDSVEGAQTQIHCAVAQDIEHLSGEHFHDCHVVKKYSTASDPNLPEALWRKTEELLK